MGNSTLKPKGWWSRRHKTREAQDEARERYQEGRGPNMHHGRRHPKRAKAMS